MFASLHQGHRRRRRRPRARLNQSGWDTRDPSLQGRIAIVEVCIDVRLDDDELADWEAADLACAEQSHDSFSRRPDLIWNDTHQMTGENRWP
jgi:hypothetical protein